MFGCGSSLSAAAPSYNIQITLSDDNQIAGHESISYRNESSTPLHKFLLQLPLNTDSEIDPDTDIARYDYSYPNGFQKSGTIIYSIRVNDLLVSFNYLSDPEAGIGSCKKNNFVLIQLPQRLLPGQTATLDIQFETIIPDKLGNGKYHQVLYLQGNWYPSIAELNLDGTFVTKNTRFIPAFYSLSVTSNPETNLVSGAEFYTKNQNDGLICQATSLKNAVTLLPLYAARHLNKLTGTYKNITINSYYLPGDEYYASRSIQYVQQALTYYEEFLGLKSPTHLISIVDNYMGSQSAFTAGNTIFIPKELRQYPNLLSRLYEVTLAHEVGHLWWGLTVSYGFDRDNWIGEGLCTFLMNKYFENRYGTVANLLEIPKGDQIPNFTFEELFSYLPYRNYALQKEAPPVTTPRNQSADINALTTIQYNKGLYIYKILYQELGDQKFIELLQYLLDHYRERILDTEGLLQSINHVSGKSFQAFFNKWVYHDSPFEYGIKQVVNDISPSLNAITRVTIKNQGQISAPLIVQAKDINNKTYAIKTKGLDEETVEIETSSSVKEVILDPYKTYPDLYRINNYYPQRTKIKPYIAIPEADSYYMSVQPSVVISSFGSYGALQARYGYLDDFNLSMDSNSDYNYRQIAYTKSRIFWPHLSLFGTYQTLTDIQHTVIGAHYFWDRSQEQVTYPGTKMSMTFESEDLYKYVVKEKFLQFYGLYNYLSYEKTGHVNKIAISLSDEYGLTPLNHTSYSLSYAWNNKAIGSDYNFEQLKIETDCTTRTGHLANLGVQTLTLLSKGKTPEEKYYHLYSINNGLKAASRYTDINDRDRDLFLARASYTFALIKNVYDTMILTRDLWLKDIYLHTFYEWGAINSDISSLAHSSFNKVVGMQLDINILSLGQFPLSLNIIGARALPEHNQEKEPIYFFVGFNGLF